MGFEIYIALGSPPFGWKGKERKAKKRKGKESKEKERKGKEKKQK